MAISWRASYFFWRAWSFRKAITEHRSYQHANNKLTKRIDFWGPVSNFGIPIAAVLDTQKSPDLYVSNLTQQPHLRKIKTPRD